MSTTFRISATQALHSYRVQMFKFMVLCSSDDEDEEEEMDAEAEGEDAQEGDAAWGGDGGEDGEEDGKRPINYQVSVSQMRDRRSQGGHILIYEPKI